jgi:hypothetical protein
VWIKCFTLISFVRSFLLHPEHFDIVIALILVFALAPDLDLALATAQWTLIAK